MDHLLDFDFTDQERSNKLKTALSNWALLFNIPLVAITALLVILSRFTNYLLPRTALTLLWTPRTIEPITTLSDGEEYLHLGLKQALNLIIKDWEDNKIERNSINLLINIDGLPIYKASKISLWLILCSEVESKNVYLIGAYSATHHPMNANEFLSKFVEDAKLYCKEGINFKNRKIRVNISGLVCDAPAKSLVLNVKGHTGYDCCPKCKYKGQAIRPKKQITIKRRSDVFVFQKLDHLKKGLIKNLIAMRIQALTKLKNHLF